MKRAAAVTVGILLGVALIGAGLWAFAGEE